MSSQTERIQLFYAQQTAVDHYPIQDRHAVVRWREGKDSEESGYILEANIGGVMMESAGNFGGDWAAAVQGAQRLIAALEHPEAVEAALHRPLRVEVVHGVEGLALYIDSYRVAGPKPWGGGTPVATWTVTAHQLAGIRDMPTHARDNGGAA